MNQSIQIVIADDHAFVRKALIHFLESKGDLRVIGEAPDGASVVEIVNTHEPDVVLMDYNMPELNGVEATRQILADHPQVQVIGLSMHQDGAVEHAMREAGAVAYLSKNGDAQTLVTTIRELAGPCEA